MKNKIICLTLALILTPSLQVTVFANNYQFGETYSDDMFGKPTTSSEAPDYTSIENVRRNKDAALFPPKYGVFGGDIPTEKTSPYHASDANKSTVTQVPEFGGISGSFDEAYDSTGGTVNINNSYGSDSGSLPSSSNITIHYEELAYTSRITSVETASDGSIGTITVPRFDYSKKVFEGSSVETMRKGVGHFESTSQWDGNVALLGHNRGSYDYFYFIKDMKIGDEVTYKTTEGTRTYKVYFKEKISEYDMSYLDYSDENILTMITCVEDIPELRWCIRASVVN